MLTYDNEQNTLAVENTVSPHINSSKFPRIVDHQF